MRVIIAGSRTVRTYDAVARAVQESGFSPSVVLSRGAFGADFYGEHWAEIRGIPVESYLADWKCHGKAAGPIRNAAMVAVADALIAVWDGRSRGTSNVICLARERGIAVFVYRVDSPTPANDA